jgi:hypothetical protein
LHMHITIHGYTQTYTMTWKTWCAIIWSDMWYILIYDVYDVWHMIVWSMVCNIKTGMYGSVTNKTLEGKQQRHLKPRPLSLVSILRSRSW